MQNQNFNIKFLDKEFKSALIQITKTQQSPIAHLIFFLGLNCKKETNSLNITVA